VPKAVKDNLKAALCLICTICLPEGGWELSNLKKDYHLLGDERQVEGAFLFRNVLFILSLIQEFLLLCEGKIFV
jgi:hypothetical protein